MAHLGLSGVVAGWSVGVCQGYHVCDFSVRGIIAEDGGFSRGAVGRDRGRILELLGLGYVAQ